MSNSLEFKISADDQASRVVETVQHKIENFGRDIAKMALGFAGPLALIQAGFGLISDAIAETKRQAEELKKFQEDAAKESAAKVTNKEAGGAGSLNNKVTAFDILNKQAQMLDEISLRFDKNQASVTAATEYWLNYTEEGLKQLERDPTAKNVQEMARAAAQAQADLANKQRKDAQDKIDAEKKILEEKAKQTKEIANQASLEARIKSEANQFNQAKEKASREVKQTSNELQKAQQSYQDSLKRQITVSSLREMGGGFSGESASVQNQINAGYSPQQQQAIDAAQEALNTAKTNSDAAIKFSASVDTFSSSVKNLSSSGASGAAQFVNPSPTQSGN